MSLLSGPPFPATELQAMAEFASEMKTRAKKLKDASHQLAKCSAMYLDWKGPAANQYSTLLAEQIRKLDAATESALAASDAAVLGLAEARRINSEWSDAVDEYLRSQKGSTP